MLSVIIFSYNDEKMLKNTIDSIYGIAEEIIVADTSTHITEVKKGKIRMLHIKNLGFPDPIKPYVLTKCKNDWILQLDTGEVMSIGFKRWLKDAFKESDESVSGYLIKRYEEKKWRIHDPKNPAPLQLRLYKKSRVKIKGNLHESPRILRGRLLEINDPDAYMMHFKKKKGSSINYSKADLLTRVSYGLLLSNPKVRSMPLAYWYVKLHDPSKELNDFDYLLWITALYIYRLITLKHFKELFFIKHDIGLMRSYKRDYPKELFNAVIDANAEGITDYLGLRSEKTIKDLSRYKKEGFDLLIELLLNEYRRRHHRTIVT